MASAKPSAALPDDERGAEVEPSWNAASSQQAMVIGRHPPSGARNVDLLQEPAAPLTKAAARCIG
jgi:hypothetical protein